MWADRRPQVVTGIRKRTGGERSSLEDPLLDPGVAAYQHHLEFRRLINDMITLTYDPTEVSREVSLGRGVPPAHFVIEPKGGTPFLIEVRSRIPWSLARLASIAVRMHSQRDMWCATRGRDASSTIVIPGILSPDWLEILSQYDIDIWDSEWILHQSARWNLASIARRLIANPVTDSIRKSGQQFIADLKKIAPGRDQWQAYQMLSSQILQFLFCPPLGKPINELPNQPKVNRRDIILPNYGGYGFFGFLHSQYHADYIVVDAKNYRSKVQKADVLQLANYLSAHGAGLFGLIVTRRGVDRGGEQTIRENWIVHRKMIVVINDEDVAQMVALKDAGADPESVIRQKIEDFRLSF